MTRLEQYPVDVNGDMIPYLDGGPLPAGAEMRGNEPFYELLALQGTSMGNNGHVRFVWRDRESRLWQMWPQAVVATMREYGVSKHGRVYGEWHIIRRGRSYGLAPYEGE